MERKKLALISFGHLSCDINGGALPACLPYLRTAHGLDYQATAAFMLAYSCLSSLVQPFFGWLADRHRKPWFVPIGIFLAGGGLAVMGFLAGYWAIFICIAISGIGSAFFHPEGARFANKFSGAQKGTGMSLFSIGGNSGFILGPLLVAFFVGHFGLGGMSAFGVIAAIMAIALAWQIALLPGGASDASPSPKSAAKAADPASAEGDELASGADEPREMAVNNWHEFSRLVVVILSRSIMFVGCNTFIPLYWVNSLGQSAAQGATALVIFGAFGVACNFAGGLLSDRIGYVPVIRIAFLTAAPILFLFALSESILASYLLLPLLGLALYLPFSSQVVLGQQLLAKNIGFASGVTLGLSTTVGGMAQPLLGWVADSYGLPRVFMVLAAVGLAGSIFTFLLSKKANA
ncbi:MAG: MFS transporter [Desulfovibrio sp.]|nr:MFS transporter [Desulfovibrio sp.]